MTSVWTGGTFDCLHRGHVELFRECGRLARARLPLSVGLVTVAVNTDEFVETYKGNRPTQSLHDRMTLVAAMRWVNEVQINPGGDAQADLILRSGAQLIVIGDDWKGRDYLGQLGIDQAWLDRYRIHVHYLPRVGGLSSTELKERIRAAS